MVVWLGISRRTKWSITWKSRRHSFRQRSTAAFISFLSWSFKSCPKPIETVSRSTGKTRIHQHWPERSIEAKQADLLRRFRSLLVNRYRFFSKWLMLLIGVLSACLRWLRFLAFPIIVRMLENDSKPMFLCWCFVIRAYRFASLSFCSETSSSLINFDSGFARETIRLEKDVLSKLGVSEKTIVLHLYRCVWIQGTGQLYVFPMNNRFWTSIKNPRYEISLTPRRSVRSFYSVVRWSMPTVIIWKSIVCIIRNGWLWKINRMAQLL